LSQKAHTHLLNIRQANRSPSSCPVHPTVPALTNAIPSDIIRLMLASCRHTRGAAMMAWLLLAMLLMALAPVADECGDDHHAPSPTCACACVACERPAGITPISLDMPAYASRPHDSVLPRDEQINLLLICSTIFQPPKSC